MCLNVAADMVFDRVVLFSTPRTIGQVRDTEKALRERHAGLFVKTIDLALADPTDYASILTDLRRHWRANRSARVDRPFSFIKNSFLAGHTFAS